MTQNITIRIATAADESNIITIWEELSAYYVSLSPVFPIRWQGPPDPQHRKNVLAKLWRDPEHDVGFVAEASGTIVGFCRAELTPEGPGGAAIHTLVVRPKFRKHGIGKQLMDATILWCDEHGAEDVSLDVLPSNVNAGVFHRSLGFEPFITSYVKRLR